MAVNAQGNRVRRSKTGLPAQPSGGGLTRTKVRRMKKAGRHHPQQQGKTANPPNLAISVLQFRSCRFTDWRYRNPAAPVQPMTSSNGALPLGQQPLPTFNPITPNAMIQNAQQPLPTAHDNSDDPLDLDSDHDSNRDCDNRSISADHQADHDSNHDSDNHSINANDRLDCNPNSDNRSPSPDDQPANNSPNSDNEHSRFFRALLL